ncbi:Alpha/Beta hydrolase protein [Paraphysoderma sedebokerense]|nr:Alpha/Beta hydrolase protein [Paraphysoderma sedebokerense]
MVAAKRPKIFEIRRNSDQWTYWSSGPKSILYFLRDLALFFTFSIQFTVRAFFFIGFYYLVYPQLEPQPKKDDPLYPTSPYFLPNLPFKTHLFIFFFRELAAYPYLELRTARFVGDVTAVMSKLKTRFSFGADFVRRKRKRPVSIEKFEFAVQKKHEVDLAEDYGEVYGGRDDLSAQEFLKGKRKLNGDLILTNGLKGNVMLYFHGGGYIYYSPAVHRSYLARLAEIGIDIYSLDYRLAPEHPFPAAIHDAVATYQYIRSDLGIPAERLFIGGIDLLTS